MRIVVMVAVGLVVVIVLWKLLRRERPKAWIQETVCPHCGWKGHTSRYAGRCPKCNAAIGERKAVRAPGSR